MSIAKVTEIKVSSPVSFDDAIQQGIARANKTLTNVKSAWVKDFEVSVDNAGKISEYKVLMKITFILED
ncbi:MAG: dodecin domain-containing protein [Actinobacteria bacterium]|nr:dodecin domain-containing protein [Actinomycetota bacterium]